MDSLSHVEEENPSLSPCPTRLLTYYKELVCKPKHCFIVNRTCGGGGPTMPTEELCSVGFWSSWDRRVSAARTAGPATGAWVVRYRVWGASRGRGSPRGGRSRSPLAHLQEASEGDQLRPTEPGGGAARGGGAKDPGSHDRRWEQQLQRAHDLRRTNGEVSPPKPCGGSGPRLGQE